MNPNDSSEISVTTLLALRHEPDALRIITDRLKVKEMGPADHIRTKHEVKAFVGTGDVTAAEALIKHASERTAAYQVVTDRMTVQQQRGQRIGQ
jgi:pyridoxal/pyridoxine/pyridoxamine kinase